MEKNEIMSASDIQDALGKLIKLEGSMLGKIGQIDLEIRTIKEDHDGLSKRVDDLVKEKRENDRIEESDSEEFKKVIINRVADILRSYDRFDLFGSFCRKCWIDAKRYSGMVGYRGLFTKRKDYNRVMDFLGTWIPAGYGGIVGYITHLDMLKENK